MALKINNDLTPAKLLPKTKRLFELSAEKILSIEKSWNPADGTPVFDNHALGCSLCVDITQDARRMLDEGKSAQDIRAAIVADYSQFGPPNQ